MTGISVVGILIMQILSNIICKTKIVYKAIILDLDDTLWKGTLSEDGFDVIKQNLNSSDATSYIRSSITGIQILFNYIEAIFRKGSFP